MTSETVLVTEPIQTFDHTLILLAILAGAVLAGWRNR